MNTEHPKVAFELKPGVGDYWSSLQALPVSNERSLPDERMIAAFAASTFIYRIHISK